MKALTSLYGPARLSNRISIQKASVGIGNESPKHPKKSTNRIDNDDVDIIRPIYKNSEGRFGNIVKNLVPIYEGEQFLQLELFSIKTKKGFLQK